MLQLWEQLLPNEIEFWTQAQRRDWQRYQEERNIYFQALSPKNHVSSFSYQSSPSHTAGTQNLNQNHPQRIRKSPESKMCKVWFHYIYLDHIHHPVVQMESRTDGRCPFCFFHSVSVDFIKRYILNVIKMYHLLTTCSITMAIIT